MAKVGDIALPFVAFSFDFVADFKMGNIFENYGCLECKGFSFF